jgi:Zn-dependent peptidase ImmA (M78 family)
LKQLSYGEIEQKAEDFLKKYNPTRLIPVPIERIVEIDIAINVVPKKSLRSMHHIDAFLSSDLTELYIDYDDYMNETNRGRFSLAYEMGHVSLHADIVKTVATIQEWKEKILEEGASRAIRENEANDFAGCVLMPRKELMAEYELQKKKAETELQKVGLTNTDSSTLNSYISVSLAKTFAVSQQAAEIRLFKALIRR